MTTLLLSAVVEPMSSDAKLWGGGKEDKSLILIGKQTGQRRDARSRKQNGNVPSVRIPLANLPRRQQLKSQLWLQRIWLGITSVSVCE